MDIRQLKYFIAVAEERNISRAAARLHISQPPLTRHIQTLEEDLGVKLFRRTNWGVELTQAGESLLSHARCIKEHVELAAEQARLASTGQVGRIDVGAYGSSMLGIVPRILDSFQRAYPQVRVVLHYAPRTSLLEGLMDRRLMLVFERYMQETQDLHVWVVPDLNAGAASLAYAVINPAVGLGTLLTQMVLQGPLADAATREFRITGRWDTPEVTGVDRSTGARPRPDQGAAPPSSSSSSSSSSSPQEPATPAWTVSCSAAARGPPTTATSTSPSWDRLSPDNRHPAKTHS